jgi:hypothetical protein
MLIPYLRSDSEYECSTQSDADNTGNSTDAGTTDGQDAEYLNEIMNEKIDGVNPNVEIYSAGVLDSDNETTVDRLVEGIEWAMECGVKILDINCGLETDSAKLHAVIKKAYKQGILIIAPAGNGKAIEYPAKYPEVMAVGAVKCNANLLECSVHGEELEVVAPGADVTTYGAFEMLTNESGTSMAAPQVAALASILWQKDVSKSADFIRSLIDATARPLGAKEDFGYGLIDCSYALKQYDEFKEKYQEAGDKTDVEIEDNDATLLLTDESLVKGFWKSHQALIYFNDNIKNVFNNIVLINKGAIWPDLKDTKQEDNKQKDTKLKDTETGKKKVIGSGLANMHVNPAFHGYFQKDWKLEGNKSVKLDSNDIKDSNYILAYMTITKYAEMLYTSDDADIYKEYGKIIEWFKENYKVTEEEEASKEEIIKALYDSTLIAFDNIHSSYYLGLFEIKEGKDLNNKTDFKDKAVMKHEYTKEDVKEIDNNKSRAYFVYGIAMHTMEDIFAHSTKGYNCTAVGSTNIVKLYPSKKYYDTAKHNYTSKDVNLTIGKFGRLIHNGLYAYYYNNVKDAKDNKDVKNDKKGYLTLSTANMFDNDKYGYNFADDMNCAPNRWESALNISQEMINELIIRASANKKKKNIFVIDRLVFANIAYIKKDKNSIQYYEIINLKKYLKPENGDLDKLERNLQTKLKEIDKKLSGNPLTADKKKLKKEKNGYIKKLNLLNMIDNAIDSVNTDNTR